MLVDDKRVRIIIGHYGSGKTEFCCNYCVDLAKVSEKEVLIADLDIVNPYFRSRERSGYLESNGVTVMSSLLGNDINFELPALTSALYAPLKNPDVDVVLDVGGDKVGARVLRQYNRFINDDECDMFAVVNANRPETTDLEGTLRHIEAIEYEAQRKVTGLINNTHMLRETSMDDIRLGQELLYEVSDKLNIPIKYVSVISKLAEEVEREYGIPVIPVNMIMRDEWM